MSDSDNDDKTGIYKNQKTRIVEKRIQVQMPSGKIYGPYTREEVLGFIESRKIRGEEKILYEGEMSWKPIAADPGFFDAIHLILSGKKIKKENKEKAVSTSFDAVENTRISTPKEDPKNFESFEPSTPHIEAHKEKAASLVPPKPLTQANVSVAHTPSAGLKKEQSAELKPKKSSSLGIIVLLLVGVFAYLYLDQKNETSVKKQSFVPRAAQNYSSSILRSFASLSVESLVLPENLRQQSLLINFRYSLNSEKILSRITQSLETRALVENKNSAFWAQLAIDLQLYGLRLQVINLKEGQAFERLGDSIVEQLTEKGLLPPQEQDLFDLLRAHSVGEWELVKELAPKIAFPLATWILNDAQWWEAWSLNRQAPQELSGATKLPADLEIARELRKAFAADDQEVSTWLLQMAAVEPESPYLWFLSAQINWRKSRNVQVQNAYRDFIIGLSALAQYPPSIQLIYWSQFAEFLKAYARVETHEKALNNINRLSRGNIALLESAEWWDLGQDGLGAYEIGDEILKRSSKGMLNSRDRAALWVLGQTLIEGADFLFVVGVHLCFENQWIEAQKIFEAILKKDPKNPEGYFGKIWTLSRQFRFIDAQDLYAEFVKTSSGDLVHIRSRGLIHYLGRDYKEADKIFSEYLKQRPNDIWAHYFRAEAFYSQKEYQECAKSANLAQLQGRGELKFRSELLFFECRVRGGVGVRDSLNSLLRMIRESPDNLPLRILYIEMMQESDLYADALRILEDSLKYFPFSAKLKMAAGDLYSRRGAPDRAIAFYNEATLLEPGLAEPWIRVAQVLEKQERFLQAAQNYEIASRVQESYPELFLMAARAYGRAGKVAEASIYYEKEIEARPEALGTFIEAAEFFLRNNSPQKVPEIYRKFEGGGFEHDPRALLRLAQALNVMGDLAQAKNFASRAVAGDPENPHMNLILANILDRAGEYQLAKRYYQSYLRLMPNAPDRAELLDRMSRPPYSN